jgi:hypothetical protein
MSEFQIDRDSKVQMPCIFAVPGLMTLSPLCYVHEITKPNSPKFVMIGSLT